MALTYKNGIYYKDGVEIDPSELDPGTGMPKATATDPNAWLNNYNPPDKTQFDLSSYISSLTPNPALPGGVDNPPGINDSNPSAGLSIPYVDPYAGLPAGLSAAEQRNQDLSYVPGTNPTMDALLASSKQRNKDLAYVPGSNPTMDSLLAESKARNPEKLSVPYVPGADVFTSGEFATVPELPGTSGNPNAVTPPVITTEDILDALKKSRDEQYGVTPPVTTVPELPGTSGNPNAVTPPVVTPPAVTPPVTPTGPAIGDTRVNPGNPTQDQRWNGTTWETTSQDILTQLLQILQGITKPAQGTSEPYNSATSGSELSQALQNRGMELMNRPYGYTTEEQNAIYKQALDRYGMNQESDLEKLTNMFQQFGWNTGAAELGGQARGSLNEFFRNQELGAGDLIAQLTRQISDRAASDEQAAIAEARGINADLYNQTRGDFADTLALMQESSAEDQQSFTQMMQTMQFMSNEEQRNFLNQQGISDRQTQDYWTGLELQWQMETGAQASADTGLQNLTNYLSQLELKPSDYTYLLNSANNQEANTTQQALQAYLGEPGMLNAIIPLLASMFGGGGTTVNVGTGTGLGTDLTKAGHYVYDTVKKVYNYVLDNPADETPALPGSIDEELGKLPGTPGNPNENDENPVKDVLETVVGLAAVYTWGKFFKDGFDAVSEARKYLDKADAQVDVSMGTILGNYAADNIITMLPKDTIIPKALPSAMIGLGFNIANNTSNAPQDKTDAGLNFADQLFLQNYNTKNLPSADGDLVFTPLFDSIFKTIEGTTFDYKYGDWANKKATDLYAGLSAKNVNLTGSYALAYYITKAIRDYQKNAVV